MRNLQSMTENEDKLENTFLKNKNFKQFYILENMYLKVLIDFNNYLRLYY